MQAIRVYVISEAGSITPCCDIPVSSRTFAAELHGGQKPAMRNRVSHSHDTSIHLALVRTNAPNESKKVHLTSATQRDKNVVAGPDCRRCPVQVVRRYIGYR